MDKDKAIRAARLTLGGMLEKKRHTTAVSRADGQIAPSKYMPNVPRAVHANGGAANAPMFQGIHESLQNESGAPLDLYHGTTQDKEFEAFDDAKVGARDAGFYGRGHYLTPFKGNAEGYADPDEMGRGTVIGPLHAALKNPYVWDMSDDMKSHSTLRDLQSMGIMRDKNKLNSWDSLQQHHIEPFMAEMKKRGHDGVVVKTNYEHLPNGISEVVAFDPKTIKHTEAEAFDPEDPRIRREDGGEVTSGDNFRNWFGGSVTHTDGVPHTLYTGTSKDKDFTSHNVGRHGAWFTRDPAVASQYAEQNDSQGYKRDGFTFTPTNTASRVIPAYVKAENPYTGELPEEYLRDNYKAAQSEWFDTLRAKGHDSWIPASQNGNLVVALKEPQQIKSIFNNGKFNPNQKHMSKADGGRTLNEHGLYSKALEVAKKMTQAKGTPEQFMAQLRSTKGVKPAELEHIGMPSGDKITRDDFIKHIRQGQPRLNMAQYGENPSYITPAERQFLNESYMKTLSPEDNQRRSDLYARSQSRVHHRAEEDEYGDVVDLPTEYQDYSTAGGENYRERLIKLGGEPQYSSSHWNHRDDNNIVAHVRMQDRLVGGGRDEMRPVIQKLADHLNANVRDLGSGSADVGVKNGVISPEEAATLSRLMKWRNGYEGKKGVEKKLLHVEEMQSDWGQEGRKGGFHDPKNPYEVVRRDTKEVVSRHPSFDHMMESAGSSPNYQDFDYVNAATQKPPAAPYVQNTQHWTDLAMKNIMREAALGDYDGIVFTPGQAQADRYGLDKKVQSLSLSRPQDGSKLGRFTARDVFGGTIHNADVADEKELHGLIGKEMGEKLLSATPVANADDGTLDHQLEGGDLKMGGAGMRGYYDNIVPKSAMSIVQQHDPSIKPQTMNINGEYDAFHVPMTREAKDSILKNGFSTFKRGGTVEKAAGGSAMGYVPLATLPTGRLAVAPMQQPQQQATVGRFSDSLMSLSDTIKGFKKKPELEDVQQTADPSSARNTLATNSAPPATYDANGMSKAANAAYAKLVDAYGQPLTINSAYRDPQKNDDVGGAKGSQHLHGNAIDVDVTGKPYDERVALANLAWDAGYRGIGFYDNSLHFDVGDPRGWGPSFSRDSIPEWAQPFAEERYGYARGGTAMNRNNYQNGGMENGTSPINFAARPQAGELPNAGGVRGGAGLLQAQNEAPLEGLPQKVVIPLTGQVIQAGADPRIRQVARDYMAQAGLPYSPPTKYARVDPKRAARIASDYTDMEDNPNDPLTKASYDAMIKETMSQYEAAKKSGLKIEFWNPRKQEDPYKASPRLATEDIRKNHHMWVFPTYSGYGSGEPISEDDAKKNPLLQLTGETWNGIPATVNDVFRAIHDYYGHAKEGLGFRADGEENAWRAHASMFSPLARMAMTSETRGQNSWLNYGPHGEHNRKARTEDTIFAPQKIGVLSHLSHHDGAEDFIKPEELGLMASIRNRFGKKLGGAVEKALSLTRRFTKDGKSAITALKPKGE